MEIDPNDLLMIVQVGQGEKDLLVDVDMAGMDLNQALKILARTSGSLIAGAVKIAKQLNMTHEEFKALIDKHVNKEWDFEPTNFTNLENGGATIRAYAKG